MTDLVVKTNKLNSAIQNLSLIEARLVQLAIVDARDSGCGLSPDKPLTISVKRYAEAFGVQAKNAYANIKEAEESLFNRRFSFIDDDGYPVKSRWVSQVKYLDDKGAIEIIFTPAVVKGISRIDGAVEFFTKYLLSNTINFKSVYSVRLYELMCQWKNADPKKIPMFELEKFRGQLGVEFHQYKAMKDFKKYILDKALSEINEYSDLTVSYEQVKSGRNIIGFKFKIAIKQPVTTAPLTMTPKQRKMFANKLSKLPELSDMAQSGWSYEQFAEYIEQDLLDADKAEFYRPYLAELGFKGWLSVTYHYFVITLYLFEVFLWLLLPTYRSTMYVKFCAMWA